MRFLNSVKALYVAVGILVVAAGLGTFMDIRNEAMHARHLEISTGLERMVRLDRELTNLLLTAILEHNTLRATRYDSVNTDLEVTIKRVIDLTREQNLSQEISALSEGRARLHAIEKKVVELIGADKWHEARGLLFGDEYVLAKKSYEIDSVVAVGTLTGELSATARRFGRFKAVSLGMRIGALLLLVWVGIMFSHRTRVDLAEQVHLRNEITVAYEAMEERVQERTADLEETAGRLALENEERLKSDARTRLILNSVGEGIFGVDTEERVTFFNRAAEMLVGYTADEVVGKELHGILHHSYPDGTPYPREECPMYLACIRGEKGHASGETLWRKDGSRFLSEYLVTPISGDKGGMDGAVIVFRDITERIHNEEELSRRMEELERFNRLTMGREERMIQLKMETNALLEEMGREKKYRVVEDEL